MAVYKVRAPDGSMMRLEGPEGATLEQIGAAAQAAYAVRSQTKGATKFEQARESYTKYGGEAPPPVGVEPTLVTPRPGTPTGLPAGAGEVVSETPREETTLAGVGGALSRAAFPAEVMAGAGALGAAALGAPIATGAALGLGAYGVSKALGVDQGFVSELEKWLTSKGVAEPKTAAERMVQSAATGGVDVAAQLAGAGAIPKTAGALTQGFRSLMLEQPTAQLAAGVGSSAAAQAANELGASQGTQLAAALIGGVAGFETAARAPAAAIGAVERAMTRAGAAAGIGPAAPEVASRLAKPGTRAKLAKAIKEGAAADELAAMMGVSPEEFESTLLARAGVAPQAPPAAAAAAPAVAPAKAAPTKPVITPEAIQGTQAAPEPLSAQQLGELSREMLGGSTEARAKMVEQVQADPQLLSDFDRLGILPYAQPGHVTTNSVFRQFMGALSTVPASLAKKAHLESLQKIGERGVKLIEDLRGTRDLSTLSDEIKTNFVKQIDDLTKKADDAYDMVRAKIPLKSPTRADDVLSFIEQRAEDLGGVEHLSALERGIYNDLKPKRVELASGKSYKETLPNYALVDDWRKKVGSAARAQGPFKDEDTGLAKKLYSLLSDDQERHVASLGASDLWNEAKQTVAFRKALEDDATALFGKHLDQSVAGKITSATEALASGKLDPMRNVIKAMKGLPPDLRQRAIVSGLGAAFGRTSALADVKYTPFANFMEGLNRNKASKNFLFSHLTPEGAKDLEAFGRIATALSKLESQRIPTGLMNLVKEALDGADNAMEGLYKEVGFKFGDAIAATLNIPGPVRGIAYAFASALEKSKRPEVRAVDRVIASPQFTALVQQSAKGVPVEKAMQPLISSDAFKNYARLAKLPRDRKAQEQFFLNLMRAQRPQATTTEEQPE